MKSRFLRGGLGLFLLFAFVATVFAQPTDPDAIARGIVKRLTDPDHNVRRAAIHEYSRNATELRKSDELREMLDGVIADRLSNEPHYYVREGLVGIAKRGKGDWDPRIRKAILGLVTDSASAVRSRVQGLMRYDEELAKDAFPQAIKAFSDPKRTSDMAQMVRETARHWPALIPQFTPFLKSENTKIRMKVVGMFSSMGSKATSALPKICGMFTDPDPEARKTATVAAFQISGYESPPALEAGVKAVVNHPKPGPLQTLLQTMSSWGKTKHQGIMRIAMEKAFNHPHAAVRISALKARSHIHSYSLTEEAIVKGMLEDESPEVRLAFVEFVNRTRSDVILDGVQKAMSDPDQKVARAAQGVFRSSRKGATMIMDDLLTKMKSEDDAQRIQAAKDFAGIALETGSSSSTYSYMSERVEAWFKNIGPQPDEELNHYAIKLAQEFKPVNAGPKVRRRAGEKCGKRFWIVARVSCLKLSFPIRSATRSVF